MLIVFKRYLNISQPISDLKFRSEKNYFRSVLDNLLGMGSQKKPSKTFKML